MASRPSISAVVDTNVILDIYSPKALLDAYERGGGTDEEGLFRRARARESLLFAWYLHFIGATTLHLPDESLRLMKQKNDPQMVSFEVLYVTLFSHFLKDYVLDRWHDGVELGCDAGLRGTACDDKLLELAEKHRAPLVSNEGYSARGISNDDPKKLRSRALKCGIKVCTPHEFWRGKMGERACKKLMVRFDAMQPKYLRRHGNSQSAHAAVSSMRGLLLHVLFGETCTGVRLPVRLGDSY